MERGHGYGESRLAAKPVECSELGVVAYLLLYGFDAHETVERFAAQVQFLLFPAELIVFVTFGEKLTACQECVVGYQHEVVGEDCAGSGGVQDKCRGSGERMSETCELEVVESETVLVERQRDGGCILSVDIRIGSEGAGRDGDVLHIVDYAHGEFGQRGAFGTHALQGECHGAGGDAVGVEVGVPCFGVVAMGVEQVGFDGVKVVDGECVRVEEHGCGGDECGA